MKALLGNPGKRRLSDSEVSPVQAPPVCPDWLGDLGRAYWQEVLTFMPAGFIVSIDGHLLAQYCHAWEEFHAARKDIDDHGHTFTDDNGVRRSNPSVKVMNAASERIKRLAACFGFSPADRVGLDFGGDSQPDDPLVAMMMARAGRN